MARGFKSTPRRFVAELNRPERRLLRTLFNDVIELLGAGETVHPVTPEQDARTAGDQSDPLTTAASDRQASTTDDDAAFWSIIGDAPDGRALQLALVIALVGALFAPRRLGWLALWMALLWFPLTMLGGFIGKAIFHVQLDRFWSLKTWLLSIVGSLIVLWIYGAITKKKAS